MRTRRIEHQATRPHVRSEHHHWRLAESVQMAPSDAVDPEHLGMLTARRHATGWFIAARHRADLSEAEQATFREFVTVRVHSLLHDGPGPGDWIRAGHDEWVNYSAPHLAPADSLAAPDTVPAHWV